jgi:hypothetical protein
MVGAGTRHSARTDKTLSRVRPVQKCWGSAGLDCGNFPVPEPGGKYKSSPVILPEEISAILPHLQTTRRRNPTCLRRFD